MKYYKKPPDDIFDAGFDKLLNRKKKVVEGEDDPNRTTEVYKMGAADIEYIKKLLSSVSTFGVNKINGIAGTITIDAGEGMNVTESGATITVAGEDASDTNKGIATFDATNFTVTSGDVAIALNGVNDTHIDWGVGANQVSAVDLPIADAGGIISATEVEGALQENRTAINLNTSKVTESTTVSDTSTVNLTLTGYDITADVIPGGVDHNSLNNLATGDVHTQYALLAGRAGGQALTGGSASGEDLTLRSTSNATKGSVLFGTAGTTEYDEANDRTKIGALLSTPDEITATSEGVAASVSTINTEVTTNGDSDLDNVTLANGVSGQIKHIYCVAVGNVADSFKITPANMVGGTQITFGASPLGLGCTLVYADDEGWVVVANNGGVIS